MNSGATSGKSASRMAVAASRFAGGTSCRPSTLCSAGYVAAASYCNVDPVIAGWHNWHAMHQTVRMTAGDALMCDNSKGLFRRVRHGAWVLRASAISGGGVKTILAMDGSASMATPIQVIAWHRIAQLRMKDS